MKFVRHGGCIWSDISCCIIATSQIRSQCILASVISSLWSNDSVEILTTFCADRPYITSRVGYFRDAKNMAKNVLETFIEILQDVKGMLPPHSSNTYEFVNFTYHSLYKKLLLPRPFKLCIPSCSFVHDFLSLLKHTFCFCTQFGKFTLT